MSRLVVVPDALHFAINRLVDAAIAELPEDQRDGAEAARQEFYNAVLRHFDEHGRMPDSLTITFNPEAKP